VVGDADGHPETLARLSEAHAVPRRHRHEGGDVQCFGHDEAIPQTVARVEHVGVALVPRGVGDLEHDRSR
jgi:hypothetical protein